MSMTGQQTQRNRDSAPAGRAQPPDSRRGAAQDAGQKTMPPRKTWLWFLVILLVNLLSGEASHAGPGSTGHGALYPVQGGGREAQRPGDLQPGRNHHGPLQGTGHLPAGGRKECGAQGEPKPRASRCAPGSAQAGELFHDDAALLRRPRFGSISDRSRGRDQRQTDPGRAQPLGDASL